MPNLNKVLLMGNLTRDPEVRYTAKGTAFADLSLAVNRVFTSDAGEKREETTFVDVTVWGRQASVAEQYLTKGRPVYIEGRLQLDSWEDKQTGQKRSKLKVVAENLQLLGGKPEQAHDRPAQLAQRPTRPAPQKDPDLEPEADDIPF